MRLWKPTLVLILVGVVSGSAHWFNKNPRIEVTGRMHVGGHGWDMVNLRETSRITGHERTLVGLCPVGGVPTSDTVFFVIDRPQFIDFTVSVPGPNEVQFWLNFPEDNVAVSTKRSVFLPSMRKTIKTVLLPGPPTAVARR